MNILYLSHCVPYPPDKGEKIRSYHTVARLARRFPVHVVCLARDKREAEVGRELERHCATYQALVLRPSARLASAAVQFAAGKSLTVSYYRHPALVRTVKSVCRESDIDLVLAFSAAMAAMAPRNLPLVADLTDVDSEKWRQYAKLRKPAWLFEAESRRLRREEQAVGARAARVVLCTEPERDLYESVAGKGNTAVVPNGVDAEYFDPQAAGVERRCLQGVSLVLVGAMDYFPNADGAVWFAREVLPAMRRALGGVEFVIVGRNPAGPVRELASTEGVRVTGWVPDVRPYLLGATCVVAPMRLARGIQNKVLEGLAMGKPVLASEEVCQTFGRALPHGVLKCSGVEDYVAGLRRIVEGDVPPAEDIRREILERYSWEASAQMMAEIAALAAAGVR